MTDFKVSIFCPHCKQKTGLSVARVKYQSNYETRTVAAVWSDKYNYPWWIGVCNYCDEPVLVKEDGEEVYPHPFPSGSDKNIPDLVRADLNEAKICFSVKAFRATACMARRAIQSAALDKGASKGNLVNQISELHTNGVITADLKDWATVVRWVGNDAAHPDKREVEKSDAEDILDLAEQFLNVIYVTPARARNHQQKRSKDV